MSDKIQELTDRLYNEGLSKGKEEGEKLLKEAEEKAAGILAKAKEDAAAIIAKAEKDASALKEKTESDVKTASEQALLATKRDIENLLVNAVSAKKTESALADTAFVKEVVRTVAEKFSAAESRGLSLILPESLQKELEPWVSGELLKVLGKETKAEFSKKISGGFTIGPGDKGWFISFTDKTFRELIAEYTRPVTRKLLFGE